ncbi:MAG: anhydro-N-acetylmuramic acid kinase [Alphaproteobacteria bacterium]|nr:anhydro-N-acetylmuramic acid kinase [Alphaproteobacteria bacterium]
MSDTVLAVGLMSGTSLDGVDAALLDTDGVAQARPRRGAAVTVPYDPAFRARLRRFFGAAALDPACAGERAAAAAELTRAHAQAVRALLERAGVPAHAVAVAGFHGQTLHHAPARGRPGDGITVQIGDGALLARLTGIPVVSDFRSADVAAGGEGAPLVPAYHQALAAGLERPLAVLNIGGVANVTYVGADGALLAFDTGPGNAPIDDWMLARAGAAFDAGGALALSGRPSAGVVAGFLADPYFARLPPKSLDRDAFAMLKPAALGDLAPADGAATLVDCCAAAVAAAAAHFPAPARRWLVTGGGRSNDAIMAALRQRLGVPVDPVDSVGWDGDALEAQAFAYLAVRSLKGLPLSFPGTTGVPRAMPGGRLHRPQGS